MNEHFKILIVEQNQVLVERGFDPENETETITVSTYMEGVKASMTMGYDDEETCDQIFLDKKPGVVLQDIIETAYKSMKDVLS